MMGGHAGKQDCLNSICSFALAHQNIIFYNMDTCLLGHKLYPLKCGIKYNGFIPDIPDVPGIGADFYDEFLNWLEKVII